MNLLITIEAGQPNGKIFRLAVGCSLLPLVSLIIGLARLF